MYVSFCLIGVTTAKPELLPCTIFILHFCLCGCILDRCPWLEACNHLGLICLVYFAQCILHSVCLCRCVGHYYLFPLDVPQARFVVPGGVHLDGMAPMEHPSQPPCLPTAGFCSHCAWACPLGLDTHAFSLCPPLDAVLGTT